MSLSRSYCGEPRMQHYMKQETELGREEDWESEEDTAFNLQCGESLSIAANHIGEDVFGVKNLLLRGLSGLRPGRRSVKACPISPLPR